MEEKVFLLNDPIILMEVAVQEEGLRFIIQLIVLVEQLMQVLELVIRVVEQGLFIGVRG